MRSLLSIASFILLFYSGQVFASESVGHVSYQSGEAWVITENGKRELSLGSEVFPSDIIVTGEKGRVKLAMNDDSHIYVSQQSRMEINAFDVQDGELFQGLLKMVWGKARFLVKTLRSKSSSFTVSTTTAVIGVRGTEFSVDVPTPQNLKARDALQLRPTVQLPSKLTTLMLFEGAVVGKSLSGTVKTIKPGQLVRFQQTGKIFVRKFTKQDVKALNINAIQRTPLKQGRELNRLEPRKSGNIDKRPILKSPVKASEERNLLPKGDSKIERPVAPVKTKTPVLMKAPANTTTPTAPVRSISPTLPTAPVKGVAPTTPTAPVRSISPTLPTAPVKGVTPTAPTAPVRSISPTLSTAPIKGIAPTAPTAPVSVMPVPTTAPTTTIVPIVPKTTTTIAPAPVLIAPKTIDSTLTIKR